VASAVRPRPVRPLPYPPWLVVAMCFLGIIIGLGTVIMRGLDKAKTGADDFLGLYAGARLACTSGIYDPNVIRKVQLETAGVTGPSLHFTRLPCFSLMLWPLAQLPYPSAHAVWYFLRVVAVVGFVILWPHSTRSLTALICCWSLPLAAGLANGQDAPLLLLWLAWSQKLERTGHSFWGGLALSMCAAKFHLFLLLPLLLVCNRRWALLAGGMAGGAALIALSFIGGGWDWPAHYLKALSDPAIHPSLGLMPNLHGFLSVWPVWLQIAAAISVGLVALVAMIRTDYLSGFAIALAGSLLLSYHAYTADAVILIPAILIVIEYSRRVLMRYAAFILASPVPWLLLLRRG
jgi:hypothetical protein